MGCPAETGQLSNPSAIEPHFSNIFRMPLTSDAQAELDKAKELLMQSFGLSINSVQLSSDDREEAPFLGRVVSKFSPLIGNLMELRIADYLNENCSQDFYWERQDPGFPDVVLKSKDDDEVLAGFEVKAWYVLSTEITGRFRESQNLLRDKNINLVIIPWCMSHMVFGTPTVLGALVVPGLEVARSRDTHYHQPPRYLIIEPNDTTDRTANLQQSNVNGFRLQEEKSDSRLLRQAKQATYSVENPEGRQAQEEADELMRTLQYRLDTNFAKLNRIKNKDIDKFRKNIKKQEFSGLKFSEWESHFQALNKQVPELAPGDDTPEKVAKKEEKIKAVTAERKAAERVFIELYDSIKDTDVSDEITADVAQDSTDVR